MAMGVCVYLKPHQAAVPPGISSNKFRLNGARPDASRLLAPRACEGVVEPGGVRITSHIPVFMSLRTSAPASVAISIEFRENERHPFVGDGFPVPFGQQPEFRFAQRFWVISLLAAGGETPPLRKETMPSGTQRRNDYATTFVTAWVRALPGGAQPKLTRSPPAILRHRA